MITIIGVAHVFDISREIERIIAEKKPDAVCVELDYARYLALKNQLPHSKNVPPAYRLLALFQHKIAAKYKTQAGLEMLTAAEAARKLNTKVELIDMPAIDIFSRLWRDMALCEKLKLMLSSFLGLFARKKKIEEELKRFEASYDQYMEMFGCAFPTVKRILIDERNAHMASALRALHGAHSNIIAVVGDGHVEGLKKLLSDLDLEIIRLSALRELREKPEDKTNTNATYNITYILNRCSKGEDL